MKFNELIDAELENEMKPAISQLLEIKKNVPEMKTSPKITVINEYIEKKWKEIELAAKAIDNKETTWQPLNELFLKIVNNE